MKVRYIGSLPRVTIPDLRGVSIERGGEIEVPENLGQALCQQSSWVALAEALAAEAGHTPYPEWTVDALRLLGEEWGLEIPAKALKAEVAVLIAAEAERRSHTDEPLMDGETEETDETEPSDE